MSSTAVLQTHFFVDGPNMDMILGKSVLGRKPLAHERPRWDRVAAVAKARFGAQRFCFVLNGDTFDFGRTPFYRFLCRAGYEVPTPKGADWCVSDRDDPVDEYIKHQLELAKSEIEEGRLSGVIIAAHDRGYAPALGRILEAGGSVAIVGFLEWLAWELVELQARGAILLDLERDFGALDHHPDRPNFAA